MTGKQVAFVMPAISFEEDYEPTSALGRQAEPNPFDDVVKALAATYNPELKRSAEPQTWSSQRERLACGSLQSSAALLTRKGTRRGSMTKPLRTGLPLSLVISCRRSRGPAMVARRSRFGA